MKWVVGTGRCGMHNYTALQGGFIQSAQQWKDIGVRRYHGEPYDIGYVQNVIRSRMELPFPCVTDCSQFIFIDFIKELDPHASFVWLQRNKKDCVESFMNREGEDHRIHPKGWIFDTSKKRELLEWYYDEVNRIIEVGLCGTKFEHIRTEDLPKASPEAIESLRVYA